MKYEPHDYQVYASEYIKEHETAAVFLECGLGKTSITLTAVRDLMFDSFEIHKVLVIAPIRVAAGRMRLKNGTIYRISDTVWQWEQRQNGRRPWKRGQIFT